MKRYQVANMKPSWRDWTNPEGCCEGSSLCASGREAARTLKESIFGVEMKKCEHFLTFWNKEEEDEHESPLILKLCGNFENCEDERECKTERVYILRLH